MALKFICGNCGSGKTFSCFNEIKNCIENGEEAIMLVPEQYSMEHEKKLSVFLEKGKKCHANVYSFMRFAYTMFCNLGGISREYVKKSGKNIIMSRLLINNRKSFKAFGTSASYAGFASELTRLISEFKRYNIPPASFAETADLLPENSYLKNKLLDLHKVYSEFENKISENGFDTDDNLMFLKKLLEGYNGFSNTSFFIDSFTGFTPSELSVIELLIKKAKNVSVALTIGDDSEDSVFEPAIKTKNTLLSIAEESGVNILPEIRLSGNKNPEKNPYLALLPGLVFSKTPGVITENPESITLLKAGSIYEEVSFAAQKIAKECRLGGERFSGFKIVVPDMAEYAPLIKEIFPLYDIAFFIDEKTDILNHPLISLTICSLEAISTNFGREAVFKYLKNGMLFENAEKIDVLENYCLKSGIKWSCFETDEKWQDSDVKAIKDEVLSPLLRLKKSLLSCETIKDFCTAIYNHAQDLQIPEKLQKSIDYFSENNEAVLAEEYSKIYGIFIETLEELVKTLGNEKIKLKEFSDLWQLALSDFEISLIPPCIDRVEITSAARFEGKEAKRLIIMGASGDNLPKTTADEGVLKSSDRESLAALGLMLAPPVREKLADADFSVYRLLAAPEKEIVISYPAADKEGAQVQPSVIIPKILHAFPKLSLKSFSDMPPEDTFLSPGEGLCAFLKTASAASLSGNPLPPKNAVASWYKNNPKWKTIYENAESALKYVNAPSPLPGDMVKKALGGEIALSVSQLERYAKCEFAYFMQFLLRAKEREIYKITAIELGSIMHRAIEEFSLGLAKSGKSWETIDEKYIKENIKTIISSCTEEMAGGILKSTKRFLYFSSKTERILERAIKLISDQFKNSDFKPLGYEIDFDNRGAYPPIELDVDGEKILLRGKIDRADVLNDGDEQYVRIVDYKSGNKTLAFSDVYFGLSLQLLTYLNALLKSLSKKGTIKVRPGGALYMRIANPIIPKKRPVSSEEADAEIKKALKMNGILIENEDVVKRMDKLMITASDVIPASLKDDKLKASSSLANPRQFKALLEYSEKKAKDLAKNILSGQIALNPVVSANEDACKFCPYGVACGFDKSLCSTRELSAMSKEEFFKETAKEEE